MSSSDALGALEAWARSGAMALTGVADGPPEAAPGDPAGVVARSLAAVADATVRRTGRRPVLPDPRLLGERAAIAALGRRAPLSCGGAFRAVPTRDGHVGLSLARQSDLELLPALLGSDALVRRVDALQGGDGRAPEWAWNAVASWAAQLATEEAVGCAELLGIPAAGVPDVPLALEADPAWGAGARTRHEGGARGRSVAPLVIDLTSLWAGPLCAHLLGLAGCRVVKVEALARPDGARRGPASFFDLLHAGHQMVALDFTSAAGRRQLADLVARADVVLESSRPRALRQLGIDAEAVVDAGTSWLSITARGRDSETVGFGDDVAVSAGLFVRDEAGTPVPCGDALADPLTGVVAAVAAARNLEGEQAELIEVSMWHAARAARAAMAGIAPHAVHQRVDGWWVEHEGGAIRVEEPWARAVTSTARGIGADNRAVFR